MQHEMDTRNSCVGTHGAVRLPDLVFSDAGHQVVRCERREPSDHEPAENVVENVQDAIAGLVLEGDAAAIRRTNRSLGA